ncbi:PfkB family carbohydrate kinase [Nonomuraea insulae]|uniref:PfkB family carbohydrate kinase n=1 Tax=Nonomuraea insulae TaxID=1616787 RepID=A0ABW1DA19_9ACTN
MIVGDTLLDIDISGQAERLCPDAPVPVVDSMAEHARPGGAGLAAMLAALDDADVVLVSAIGNDSGGRRLHGLLADQVEVLGLPLRGSTNRKTRIRVKGQTLLRVDTGDGYACQPLDERAGKVIRGAGAILVSDYGLGTVQGVRDILNDAEAPIVWDPHYRGAVPVPGCGLLTPSEAEAEVLSGENTPALAAEALLKKYKAHAVAVTLGERGALLARQVSASTIIPAQPVGGGRDACGAGDRLAGAVALALRDGVPIEDAVSVGVGKASDFVAKGGVNAIMVREQEIDDRPRTALEVAELTRARGGRLIATGGCFDLLHAGHVSLLRRARALGDALIVCLNSDISVSRIKGNKRPIVGDHDRAEVLNALSCVDGVFVFDEEDPSAAIEILRPDVWVKGDDYAADAIAERPILDRIGAEAIMLSTLPGYSTTALIERSK